jgi:hypothetical protein
MPCPCHPNYEGPYLAWEQLGFYLQHPSRILDAMSKLLLLTAADLKPYVNFEWEKLFFLHNSLTSAETVK